MKSFSIAVALTAALGAPTAAFAAPDPTDPRAAIPNVQYRSPFHDYRPLGEDKSLAWKAANEEVQRIGGWRAYAKEASEANAGSDKTEKAAPSVSAPSAAPAPEPAAKKPAVDHSGHGKQK